MTDTRCPAPASFRVPGRDVTAAAALAQADRAAALGLGVVIVDDGWQTTPLARGYGWCGDGEATADRFPEPAGLIADP
ncbi:hypothetical protein ACWDE9_07270 [Streptomyces olivaceoviridis]